MNDHLKRELYNLGQFAHHGACNAALVYIAKLEQALTEASKDAARLKDILRGDHNNLVIRMSLSDFHAMKIISTGELNNSMSQEIISYYAGMMYRDIAAIKENQHDR